MFLYEIGAFYSLVFKILRCPAVIAAIDSLASGNHLPLKPPGGKIPTGLFQPIAAFKEWQSSSELDFNPNQD